MLQSTPSKRATAPRTPLGIELLEFVGRRPERYWPINSTHEGFT
jgi:hypothetical protein